MNRRGFFKLLSVSPIALILKPEKKFTRDKLIVNDIKLNPQGIPMIAWDDYFGLSNSPIKHPIRNEFILLTSDDGSGTAGIRMKFAYHNRTAGSVYKTMGRVK